MKEVVDAIDLSNSTVKNKLFHQQKVNESAWKLKFELLKKILSC